MATKKLDIEMSARGDVQAKNAIARVGDSLKELKRDSQFEGFKELADMARGGGIAAAFTAASQAIFGTAKAMRELADASGTAVERLDMTFKSVSNIPVLGSFFDFAFGPGIDQLKKNIAADMKRRADRNDIFGADADAEDARFRSRLGMDVELRRMRQDMGRNSLSPFNDRIDRLRAMEQEAVGIKDRGLSDRIAQALIEAEKAKDKFIADEARKEEDKRRESERKARAEVNESGRKFFEGMLGGFMNFGEGLRKAAFVPPENTEDVRMADIIRTIEAERGRGTTGALAAAREPVQAVIQKTHTEAKEQRVSMIETLKFVGGEITALKNQFFGIRV